MSCPKSTKALLKCPTSFSGIIFFTRASVVIVPSLPSNQPRRLMIRSTWTSMPNSAFWCTQADTTELTCLPTPLIVIKPGLVFGTPPSLMTISLAPMMYESFLACVLELDSLSLLEQLDATLLIVGKLGKRLRVWAHGE